MPTLETFDGKNLPAWTVLHLRHRQDPSALIDRFDRAHHFLSNFYRVSIASVKHRRTFASVEHAFQYAKAFHAKDHVALERLEDIDLSVTEAKRLGAQVTNLPATWASFRVRLMLHLLTLKFAHPGLAGLLRKTRGFRLVEGNYWHDNFWGICSCKRCPGYGHNILGKQLEKIRESL